MHNLNIQEELIILGIDTSCDDTAIAITKNDCVLANIVSSQIRSHKNWGGVVPSIAKREHERLIDGVLNEALKKARVRIEDIDLIAVTKGRGLAIALEVGIKKAKEIALLYNKPILPTNHSAGHIYSILVKNKSGKPSHIEYAFPFISLLISGGHTELILVTAHNEYLLIGKTLDDAIGEAYDKIGKMLGLGYPSGPIIEELARSGDEKAYELPLPMRKKNNKNPNFSYSGLKTAVMQIVNQQENFTKQEICNIAASFQKVAIEHLIDKLNLALEQHNVQDIFIAGGVSSNLYLRKKIRQYFKNYRVHFPPQKKLCTDNAGMIAVASYYSLTNVPSQHNLLLHTKEEIESLDRDPSWRLSKPL